jgi:hypothetical protein
VTVFDGFDAEDFRDLAAPLTITGLIYSDFRHPTPSFEGVLRLGRLASRVGINLYRPPLPELEFTAQQYGGAGCININPPVFHREAHALHQISDVLLPLLWNSSKKRGILSEELFDMLG